MDIPKEAVDRSKTKPAAAELVLGLPFRLAFSAVLAVVGICVKAYVPAVQASPYVFAVILFLAFSMAVWGFKALRQRAGDSSLMHSILEVSGLALVILVVVAFHQPLAAVIQSLFGH